MRSDRATATEPVAPSPAEWVAEHRYALGTALRNDAASALVDAETMRQCARALRSGQIIGIFAPGEPGAVAADRLADQHEGRRKAALAALDTLDRGLRDDLSW